MIPKKIHYCWLSNDKIPQKLQRCMTSWEKYLPEYEQVRWDLKRFPLDKSLWVRQAFEAKKYAFAADYIRLYALATEGGIYLDMDVEVLKSFDDLLHLPYFICKENGPQGIEAAVIGAEKGCGWIKKCLAQYEGVAFINEKGMMKTEVLPRVIKTVIGQNFTMVPIENVSEFDFCEKKVCYLPCDYFSPKNYATKKIAITQNTYCIHHFVGSWQSVWKRLLLNFWMPFSIQFPRLAERIKPDKGGCVRRNK